MPHLSVSEVDSGRVTLAFDTDDIRILTEETRQIQGMKGVKAAYPIFGPDSLRAS